MLADECGQYRSLVLLLGVGGLRWGEAIALRPCDIDFLRRRIELHRNVVRVGSEVPYRLAEVAARAAPWWCRAFVMDELARTAEGKGREELMWTAPRAGGYLQAHRQDRRVVADRGGGAARQVDPTFPRVTPHALRHTAASLAITRGRESEGGAADAWPCHRRR